MGTDANQLHVREHTSLLARAEKRVLERLAKRMPDWVTSDHLTLLGLVSMLLAGCAYWAASWNHSAESGVASV